VNVHELSRTEARRIAVRAQLLDSARPADLLELVRHLTMLQNDPTSAVAPSAELVAWSRLGPAYSPADLTDAIETCTVIELRGMIRPAEDLALYRAAMAEWPGTGEIPGWRQAQSNWVNANNAFRLDILDRLRRDGPLTSRELPNDAAVPWRSTGWNNNRNLPMMLEFLVLRGEVSTAGRRGRDKLWDLASRIYPDTPVPSAGDAARMRDDRRLRALGIARATCAECPVEPMAVGAAGEPAVVEGVKGTWRVDPAQLGQPFHGRAALLSPFDRLVYDRRRTTEIFEFDYQVEMFKPAAKRRWGYFALPILYADRLVGKLDATADRKAGVLRVDAVHEDAPFTKTMSAAVHREISELAAGLDLALVLPG
jgi:uncharacterized protein YcaQ